MKYIIAILSIILINILLKILDIESALNLNFLEDKIVTKFILLVLTLLYIFWYFKFPKNFFFKNYMIYFIISIILIIISYNFLDNLITNKNSIYKFTLYCLLTGIFEELFSRVFVFFVFLTLFQNDIKKGIIYSSILFGLLHLSNLFDNDVIVLSVITQVIFASVISYFLFGLLIKTKNIVVPITVHFLMNYFGSYNGILTEMKKTTEYDINSFLSTIFFLVILSFIIIPITNFLINSKIKTWHNIVYN